MKPISFSCLLLLVLLPFLANFSCTSALECPPVEEDKDLVFTNNGENYDTSKYSKGELSRGLVESIRNKPESYYQDIVDNVIMLICDTDVASERCIDESIAAKDWEGNCIVAADYQCPIGTCERTSNCYWNTAISGENRTTRFDPNEYVQAADKLYGTDDSYARDIGQIGIIVCIVSLLLLFLWIIFFISRYLCCCLWDPCTSMCFICSPIPRQDGYNTLKHIVIPVLFYVIAIAGVTAAGSMAFVGNEDISVAISNAFLHTDSLVEDLSLFLGRSEIPLKNLGSLIDVAAVDAQTIFNGTSFVKEDALQIVNSFVGYFELHSEGLNISNTVGSFSEATTGFDERVTPIIDNVQSMLDTMEYDLFDKADLIKEALNGALDSLDSFSDTLVDYQSTIYEYEGKELGTRDVRKAGVMTLFLLSFFFSILGFIGICVAKSRSPCLSMLSHAIKVTGFFSAWLAPVSLIFASISLCLSFVTHDVCQMSKIVTQDFEPFVGNRIALGANAAFNDTNLAEAFNVTDKVDFQQKLDEGLLTLEAVNITNKFELVLTPLSDINGMLSTISSTALDAFNLATSSNDELCSFTDTYTKENILTPWELDRDTVNTPYVIRDNLGNPVTYDRIGLEDSESYFERIYNKAGTCSAEQNCCIAPPPLTGCISNVYDDCDSGLNCAYPCEILRAAILEGYDVYVDLRQKELEMTADLGVVCPSAEDYTDSCPTSNFASQYSNLTLVESVQDYKGNIIGTKDSLVNLASTSVGSAMFEVEDFLCNMNISFVEQRYDEVKNDVCGTLFGGLAQINWGCWLLSLSLQLIAILSHVLAVRLKGISEKEAAYNELEFSHNERAEIY